VSSRPGFELVPILSTSNRPYFDAACSLLRHEGIPFRLRELRGGLVPYVVHDQLEVLVPADRADEAARLLPLLEEPAQTTGQPYRSGPLDEPSDFDDPEGARDPAMAASEWARWPLAADEHDEPDEVGRARRERERARGALVLVALCTLAAVVVTVGLQLAYRERFAAPGPRITPRSAEVGATSPGVLTGR
jgi:hypothetical protein